MAEESSGIGSGLAGMLNVFVDPGTTAKHAAKKGFWLWPAVTLVIGFMVFGYLMMPYNAQLGEAKFQERAQTQNLPAEQVETAKKVTHIIGYVLIFVIPVFVILFSMLFAWLVNVMLSMVAAKGRFRDTFGLMLACGLIPFLQYAAGYVEMRAKGDPITNQEQMQPPFGLDIFLQGLHGVPLAFVHFFSIFQIWYLVVLTVGISALYGISKGKAFAAITPAWVVPLIFALIGAAFSGKSGG
jgi:membrane-associated PAP2 superfamily phosphatase